MAGAVTALGGSKNSGGASKSGGGGGGYSNQTAATASGQQDGQFNDSGWVINFKGSGTTTASTGNAPAMSGPLYAAIAVAAVLWLTRKH